MLELVDYLAFAAALAAGVGMGRALRPKPPKPLRPVCTCEHGYGQHDGGARCNAQTQQASKYDLYGHEIAWTFVPCPCLSYDGPDPVILGLTGGRA